MMQGGDGCSWRPVDDDDDDDVVVVVVVVVVVAAVAAVWGQCAVSGWTCQIGNCFSFPPQVLNVG
jgi:hypothetical protein